MAITDPVRRGLVLGGAAAAGVAMVSGAVAHRRTDAPGSLDNQPMPEPAPEKSAGPVKPGRGSSLADDISPAAVFLASDDSAQVI
jgi:hypothetical protein